MTHSFPREIPFSRVRLRFASEKRFDEIESALWSTAANQGDRWVGLREGTL